MKCDDFDEYYNLDGIEIGRKGTDIIFRNNLSDSEVKNNIKELAEQFTFKKAEIDNQIKDIISDIKKCNPLTLLLRANYLMMSSLLNTYSEFQISPESNLQMRAVEYIQSVLASQKFDYPDESESDSLEDNVIENVSSLYSNVVEFYFYWGAKAIVDNNDLTSKDIDYIVESQLMSNVRGNRYQFQQLTCISELLAPHTGEMERIYGITTEEFINGLEKLEYALSSEKIDLIKKLAEFYQENVTGHNLQEIRDITHKNHQMLESQCNKIFGLAMHDVKQITGWNDKIINGLSWEIGECDDFLFNAEYGGWPIIDMPIQKKPFIKIDGVSYCFDYYNLFDNIYRVIQKDIKKQDSKYSDQWAKLQQEASESLVEKMFKKLLPNCESYVGNYYPIGKSLKQMDENDIIVLFDDSLIIAEVKAGSFTYTPAITDLPAHKKSFEALINKANYQCERTLDYYNRCQDIVGFYDENKHQKFTFGKNKIKNVYTFCVTVDNFNAFEAKIEKTHFSEIKDGTIAISIDDLDAYTAYFDSPLYFMHFLKHRKEATKVKELMLNDELDHLGMYIFKNSYDQIIEDAQGATSITGMGFREEIDGYFAGLHNTGFLHEKPRQEIPLHINAIISLIEREKMEGRVSLSAVFLDLPFKQRHELSDMITYVIGRQITVKSTIPIVQLYNELLIIYIQQDGLPFVEKSLVDSYTKRTMLKHNARDCWEVLLKYNYDKILYNIEFKKVML